MASCRRAAPVAGDVGARGDMSGEASPPALDRGGKSSPGRSAMPANWPLAASGFQSHTWTWITQNRSRHSGPNSRPMCARRSSWIRSFSSNVSSTSTRKTMELGSVILTIDVPLMRIARSRNHLCSMGSRTTGRSTVPAELVLPATSGRYRNRESPAGS